MALYGQSLTVNAGDGSGKGPLYLADGSRIAASWNFTCLHTNDGENDPTLWLEFEVSDSHGLSDSPSFGVAITQSTSATSIDYDSLVTSPWTWTEWPVEIFYKQGPASGRLVHIDTWITNESAEHGTKQYPAEDVIRGEGGGWQPVETFTSTESGSYNGDGGSESDHISTFASKNEMTDEKMAEDCHTWKCWMGSTTKSLKNGAGHLYDDLKSHSLAGLCPGAFSCVKSKPDNNQHVVHNPTGSSTMKPLSDPITLQSTSTPTPTARFLTSLVSYISAVLTSHTQTLTMCSLPLIKML